MSMGLANIDAKNVPPQREDERIEFAEREDAWGALPHWVTFFLNLGYTQVPQPDVRRICIISTPCDSAAAGLAALGAIRRRLELPEAGDLAWHRKRLRDLCARAPGDVQLRHAWYRGLFRFHGVDPDNTLWVQPIRASTGDRMRIVEEFASDWRIDGEPQVQVRQGMRLPFTAILSQIVETPAEVDPTNLVRSDSAICFAGRIGGEIKTRDAMGEVHFRNGSESGALSELLSVHGWHPDTVSRISFFNSRTKVLDRDTRNPELIFVDGGPSFLRVLDDTHFRKSDIVAVIPRVYEDEQVEEVAQQVGSLSQWYSRDDNLAAGLRVPSPPAVSILALKRV